MSNYHFAPCPDRATNENLYAFWKDGFSAREIKDIISIGEDYLPETGVVDQNRVDDGVRKSKVSWIGNNNRSSWLYDRMAYITRNLNGQFFDYDLYGFVEDFQYTVYEAGGDHYTWHMDRGSNSIVPRKLSIVVMLSDPSEYEGGDLELFTRPNPTALDKTLGMVHAFPSYVLHRVTPVTRGIRRTLVIWVTGPKFR